MGYVFLEPILTDVWRTCAGPLWYQNGSAQRSQNGSTQWYQNGSVQRSQDGRTTLKIKYVLRTILFQVFKFEPFGDAFVLIVLYLVSRIGTCAVEYVLFINFSTIPNLLMCRRLI